MPGDSCCFKSHTRHKRKTKKEKKIFLFLPSFEETTLQGRRDQWVAGLLKYHVVDADFKHQIAEWNQNKMNHVSIFIIYIYFIFMFHIFYIFFISCCCKTVVAFGPPPAFTTCPSYVARVESMEILTGTCLIYRRDCQREMLKHPLSSYPHNMTQDKVG